MLQLADGLMLLALSFIHLAFYAAGTPFVTAFLIAIIVFAGDTLFSFDARGRWRLGGSLSVGIFLPEICFFAPIFLYKACEKRQWWYLPAIAAETGIQALAGGFLPVNFGLILLSGGIAAAAAMKTGSLEERKKELCASIDSGREQSLLMEEKNRVLREKQDYEIYTATLRERNRIAREIHDNVGHLLSRSILLSGAIQTINRDDRLWEPLQNLQESLNTAMTSIRSSVHDLHDEAVDLETAARELAAGFSFCPVKLQFDMSRSLPREVKYCYLAILKEALNNIMKHSGATAAEVQMREQPGFYQLAIRDNGIGGEMRNSGIGLSNMEQRVKELDGLLRIHTEKGFEIFITIPKRRTE